MRASRKKLDSCGIKCALLVSDIGSADRGGRLPSCSDRRVDVDGSDLERAVTRGQRHRYAATRPSQALGPSMLVTARAGQPIGTSTGGRGHGGVCNTPQSASPSKSPGKLRIRSFLTPMVSTDHRSDAGAHHHFGWSSHLADVNHAGSAERGPARSTP